MQYESINRINVMFDKNDIVDYNVSGGTYSASISIKTVDGKVAELKFDNTQELRSFIEHIIHAALEIDWNVSYPSTWHNARQDVNSIEDVKAWKEQFTARPVDQDVMPPF